MICPDCNSENAEGTSVCHNCGSSLVPSESRLTDERSNDLGVTTKLATPSLREWRKNHGAHPEILPEGMEIGSRYVVVKLLGQGGMGAVYLVHDVELNRETALKLIRSELAEDPSVLARFKREIHLSSQITHPNVLRVYDLGESEGIKFLTMQYVSGEDLATKIKREIRLKNEELIPIFRQICQGLAAAHRQGVTHRDLKPQNIMVDAENQVYLMDFGLAQSVELTGLTETGTTLGTPYYMSPEQVKGEELDARSDIYSLGVILYEMATGTLPFSGSSAYQVMIQRVHGPPKPVTALNPDLPLHLLKILEKCMAIEKSLRYGSAEEILEDLERESVRFSLLREIRKRRWLQYGLLTVSLLAVVWGVWTLVPEHLFQTTEEGVEAVEAAVPVLGIGGLQNLTGNSELDWYGSGIAQLVADNLAGSRHVRIASVPRVEKLQSTHTSTSALYQAAAQLGIGYLLSGEILQSANGLVVATRLTDTIAVEQIAARRIEGLQTESLLASAEEITKSIQKGMNLPLQEGADVYVTDFAVNNPEAYELYLRGLQAHATFQYEEAEQSFLEALDLSPDYTMARYYLASVLGETGRMEEALEQLSRAVQESSRLPDREARYVVAADAWYNGRYEEAIDRYQELLQKYPYETQARYFLASVFDSLYRFDEEARELEKLASLQPEMPTTWSALGSAYLQARDFSRALEAFLRYAMLQPENPNSHEMLGNCYRGQGELDLAITEYETALRLDPDFVSTEVELARAEFLAGNLELAEQRLQALHSNRTAPPRYRIDSSFVLASLLRAQGRFVESASVLASIESELQEEKVREAMGLAVRALSLVEVGQFHAADSLIDQAVEKSPGAPTRYLFAQGISQLQQGHFDEVQQTVAEILEYSLPPEDRDRTEEKTAAYLKGMIQLKNGRPEEAIPELSRSVALSGYEYAIYRLGLGRAYFEAGRLQEAMAAARQAAEPLDPIELRFDLELDRLKAKLLLAKTELAMERKKEAEVIVKELVEIWSGADPEFDALTQVLKLLER